MSTKKEETLKQVQDAIEIIEEARVLEGLAKSEITRLETASVKLRNLERNIIRMKTNELVVLLTSDANALKDLAVQINQSAEKLAKIASTLEKTVSSVNLLIKAVAGAAGLGLI
jgi:hypothetical protein